MVFNYSSLHLTVAMKNLLNRGFNFSILPKKVDLTQVFVDFKRFERSAIWTEFHYGKDEQNYSDKPMFKKQMTNLPKNYTVPEGLKTFLNSVKSEISVIKIETLKSAIFLKRS